MSNGVEVNHEKMIVALPRWMWDTRKQFYDHDPTEWGCVEDAENPNVLYFAWKKSRRQFEEIFGKS